MIRSPSRRFVYASLLPGLLFAVLPLPAAIGAVRPWLLALLMLYWAMEAPAIVGLGTAFLVGLLADVVTVSLFGEQAFRLVLLVFVVHHFRARLRFFPLWQQALVIGFLMCVDRFVVYVLHALAGQTQAPIGTWFAPVLAMLLWPWLYVLLDMARMRAREQR